MAVTVEVLEQVELSGGDLVATEVDHRWRPGLVVRDPGEQEEETSGLHSLESADVPGLLEAEALGEGLTVEVVATGQRGLNGVDVEADVGEA